MKSKRLLTHEELLIATKSLYDITLCKNQINTLHKEDDTEEGIYEYTPTNIGCTNQRRNGSAYCQECSNKYNNK